MKRLCLFMSVPLALPLLVAGLALSFWTMAATPARASIPLLRQEAEAVESLVQVGKYRLNFRIIEGGEPTILLEAGGGMDSRVWNNITAELARKTGATIVSYDRAGFGKSDLPETPLDMREEVGWLWQGLKKLKRDQGLILVGHSFGGWMIRLFASEHPEVVRGMVFVDPFTNEFVDMMGVEYLDNHPMAGKIPFDTSQPEKLTKLQRALVRMVGDGLGSKMEVMRKTSVPSDIPVIVMTAGKPFLPKTEEQEAWRRSHEQLTASIKGAMLIVAEESDHMIPARQPDLIIEAVMKVIHKASMSFAANSPDEEMNLQKVAENLYMVSDAVAGNSAFLVTEDGVLCVDAKYFPYQGEQVVKTIRRTTDKPIKYLVYTHWHSDHTRGAQSFPSSAVIIAHQNTLRLMEEEGPALVERDRTITFPGQLKALEEKAARLKAEQSPKLEEAEKELEFKRFQVKDFQRLKLVLPEITFEEKAAIHMEGRGIELIYLGKGHTEGDIVVCFPDEKVVQFGDLLGYPGEEEERIRTLDIVGRLKKMDPEQRTEMLRSVDDQLRILGKAAALDFEIAIPGHGKLTDKKGVIDNISFLKKFRVELNKAVGMDQ